MKRIPRATTRRAVLLAFGAAMGKFNVLRAQKPIPRTTQNPTEDAESRALLIVDLGQWRGLQFKHKGKSVIVPVSEVFDALVEGAV